MRQRLLSLCIAAVFMPAAANASSIAINFDEFTSPPVTCCYGSGLVGPIAYPDVTITGLGSSSGVMNNTGWANMQTSGNNLYGSRGRTNGIDFAFNSGVSNLFFDVIQGDVVADTLTVTFLDSSNNVIFTQSIGLNQYTTPGSVARFGSNVGNIWSATVSGSANFAVDTINFDTRATAPEPASMLLLGTGLALVAAHRRRRRA